MLLTKQKTKRRHIGKVFILVVVLGVVGVWQIISHMQRMATAHEAVQQPPAYTMQPNWPSTAQAAAIGIKGYGPLASTGDQHKRPIASIAKVITALALVDKHPIKPGEDGPAIQITDRDEQLYRDYSASNGTVVLVKAGTAISLHDALEAMLLPSANNIADTAAIWGFGSLEDYQKYANDMLQRKGLHDTVVGEDASGFDPSTQSTASDLVRLGELALDNPVIAEIVGSQGGDIPVAGPLPNYNALVTKHGFIGIKPGDTLEAGITSLFATKAMVGGQEVTLVGSILGAGSYEESNQGAMQIVESTASTAAKQ